MSRERVRLGSGYRKLYLSTAISNIGDGMSMIAYPWLATAITRNPLLVAIVAAAQRLPWLVFTLPAGVITDRVDRRRAMVWMDLLRGTLTAVVAIAVLSEQGTLPAPDQVKDVVGTRIGLYLVLVLATLLLGCAEVMRDNCGQTLMPSLVEHQHLERASGRLWSIESVANTFIGPPLGSLLLLIAFSVPFFIDAATFFTAAALVALIPGTFRSQHPERVLGEPVPSWRDDLKQGVRWLYHHRLLWSMAIILGLMNMASMISGSMFVLFAQDVLTITPLTFAFMGFGFGIGAVIGGYVAPWLSKQLGSGTCLALTLGSSAVVNFSVGLSSWWPITAVLLGVVMLFGSSWNVITVSLRQSIIPPHLLGRVNSVYRFFGWGMMPIGAMLGGVVVTIARTFTSHETSLRAVWFVDGAVYAVLFLVGRRLLTTERLEAARAAGLASNASSNVSAASVSAATTIDGVGS